MEHFLNPLHLNQILIWITNPDKAFVKRKENQEGDRRTLCLSHSSGPIRFVSWSLLKKFSIIALWLAAMCVGVSGGFRYGRHGQLPRAASWQGAPTGEGKKALLSLDNITPVSGFKVCTWAPPGLLDSVRVSHCLSLTLTQSLSASAEGRGQRGDDLGRPTERGERGCSLERKAFFW